MREVKGHAILGQNTLASKLKVEVFDEPECGANHKYQIYYKAAGQWEKGHLIQFHKLQPKTLPLPDVAAPEEVPNGITNEVLISIVLDRLRSFQNGAFPCRENALAITKLEEAIHWLKSRTLDRIERGVVGKLEK